MPNKTIYVTDADLPVFERAQELAGENLSATIAQALRRFVDVEEAKTEGFGEITLKVGTRGTYTNKQFLGRELAKRRDRDAETHRMITQTVFQTVRGRLVLYTRNVPDWYAWQSYWDEDDWSGGRQRGHEERQQQKLQQRLEQRQQRLEQKARHKGWHGFDWSMWSEGNEYHMEIFETPEELQPRIAEDLYNAIVQALKGEDVEILDI